jgi:hypothetical protein
VIPVRFIFLMPWGRVGSNLLVAILKRSARVKMSNESLNRLRTPAEQTSWFGEFYEIDSSNPSRTHIGSKQNVLAIRDFPEFCGLLKKHQVRIVRLRRDNVVKTAVSQMRAEYHAEKMQRETGAARWALTPDDEILGRIRLDPDTLQKRIVLIDSLQQKLMAAFSGETVLDIEYEEINTEIHKSIRRVRRYLDLPHVPFEVPFRKATPDALSEAIENFVELRGCLSGTPWASQIAP